MILQQNCDVLEAENINVIIQIFNLHNAWSSRFHSRLKANFPVSYRADLRTMGKGSSKFGTVSGAVTAKGKMVANLYAIDQNWNLSYEALEKCLTYLHDWANSPTREHPIGNDMTFGIQYGNACGTGAGSWREVEAAIINEFTNSDLKFVICRKEDEPDLD